MLWLTFVPTQKPPKFMPGKKRFFSTRYHRLWDTKVMRITGGMSIWLPIKGKWVSPDGQHYNEDMIPVIVSCTADEMTLVCNTIAAHYAQLGVSRFKLSDDASVLMYPENQKYHDPVAKPKEEE